MLTFITFVLNEERDHHNTIRNLLALANRPGTEAEGQTARDAAHRLAHTHGIDISNLNAGPKVAPASRKPSRPKAPSPKHTEPYKGPFPRNRHSHKCPGFGCKMRGQTNSVGCYKQHCIHPQSHLCAVCRASAQA